MLREVSLLEWRQLRQQRGHKLTGFPAHTVYGPKAQRYAGTYHWPWGGQPSLALREKLIDKCPLKAAERFLRWFEKCSGTHHEGRGYAEPKPKAGTPKWMHQATHV